MHMDQYPYILAYNMKCMQEGLEIRVKLGGFNIKVARNMLLKWRKK